MSSAAPPVLPRAGAPYPWLRLTRHELAGAFGDLGTTLPLLVGMIMACGLDPGGAFTAFGVLQICTGLVYGVPMPVQPLKAVAAMAIAGHLRAGLVAGAGIAIGVVMFGLMVTGSIERLGRLLPKAVVRGIQIGLGLKLASLALGSYIVSDGWSGAGLAALSAVVIVLLRRRKGVPAAFVVVALGIVYAALAPGPSGAQSAAAFSFPHPIVPSWAEIAEGFVLLALPQIPLSLANSLYATEQTMRDLFPARAVPARRLALTYALMNLVAPWLGGVPVCHGSGGMAGHYAFGARTGTSVLASGLFFLALGLFFAPGFGRVLQAFPLPTLGVLLLFESATLVALSRDLLDRRDELVWACLVGVLAATLPHGFVVAMVVGTLGMRLWRRRMVSP